MSPCYLLDSSTERGLIRLILYDTSNSALRVVEDRNYRPYFFVPYPLSVKDETLTRSLSARASTIEKRDLFNGTKKTMTRIELDTATIYSIATKQFEEKWEDEITQGLGYIYDHDLVFGALYLFENETFRSVYEVPEDLRTSFEQIFLETKNTDPLKYEMLERWFALCSQPIPAVSPKELGLSSDVEYQKLYLAFLLSRIANLPLPVALLNHQVSVWIRSILHCYLRRKNILIPKASELTRGETEHQIQGALTFTPKSGTYFNTVVTDFESLYPSIIDSYNLSYETVNCGHGECMSNKIPGLDYYICTQKRGIYSILTGALRDLRIRWFKPLSKNRSIPAEERLLAEAASKLLKLILVSSYGVTVRIHGLAQPALAESITAYGRHVLKKTWDLSIEGGLQPVYGDTDSLFLDNPSDQQVKWLINTVKDRLGLDLAVDKTYSVCVLPRAMKAYFGINKDGTPDVKGVTAIKSNASLFIQKVFNNCVKELVNVRNWGEFEEAKNRIQEIVKSSIIALKSGKIPLEDLEYTVTLHFDPSERPSDEWALHQPHQCAVQLMKRGIRVQKGDTVSFVKVKPFNYGGKTYTVKPTDQVKDMNEIDQNDYIRSLETALNQTFKPMNISFEEEIGATLADFI